MEHLKKLKTKLKRLDQRYYRLQKKINKYARRQEIVREEYHDLEDKIKHYESNKM